MHISHLVGAAVARGTHRTPPQPDWSLTVGGDDTSSYMHRTVTKSEDK